MNGPIAIILIGAAVIGISAALSRANAHLWNMRSTRARVVCGVLLVAWIMLIVYSLVSRETCVTDACRELQGEQPGRPF